MATKAELQEELAQLKAQMAQRDAPDDVAQAKQADDATSGWGEMLRSHGLDAADTEALMTKLSEELGDLPRNKPLITAIAAFGVGFVLGRMSK